MIKRISDSFEYIRDSWEDLPWVRAAVIDGWIVAALITLNSSLSEELSINLAKLDNLHKAIILAFIVILYFLLAAIFSGDRLLLEKQLRKQEQSFRYDKKGTLYNGGEPNIAFRIATFKGILENLSRHMDSTKMQKILNETGRKAGEDFAAKLSEIYNSDVANLKAKSEWMCLSFKEKLNQWAEYDSSTGWGILSCSVDNNKVKVKIKHLNGLCEGRAGLLFGCFLCGYSETIISRIVSSHKGGRYGEYNVACILTHPCQYGNDTIEFEFTLEYREDIN